MKSIAVSGAPGKDVQIKIDSIENLPSSFQKHLRRTVAYSKIPEAYGPEWSVEKVFEELEKHSVQPIYYSYGGRAPHIAYGVARLGGDVSLIAEFGDDLDKPYPGFFGGGYWSHLSKSGVKMQLMKVKIPESLLQSPEQLREYLTKQYAPKIYQTSVLQVLGRETSTIVCCKDLSGIDFFYIDDIKGASSIEVARPSPREVIAKVDIVFITTSERQFMEDMILTATQLKKEVLMDVGSYGVTPVFLRKTIPLAKIIFGNPSEIKQVCDAFQVKKVDEIFNATKTKFPEIIILEDKLNGSAQIYTRQGGKTAVGPIPLNKTGNSIGCCDGIATGFLALYQHGLDLQTCVRAGLTLCASIWEVEGVQEGMLDKSAFCKRFNTYFSSKYSEKELRQLRDALA